MLPSKSITPLLGNSYGQDPPDSVLIVSGKQQLTKRRFYEHLRDPRPPASYSKEYSLHTTREFCCESPA